MHTVVQHADTKKHRARNEAVGNHLHQRTFGADLAEDEKAQRDETHVRDRRVRDQFFHVALHQRDEADVDHRDQRQDDHHGREEMARVRHDGQRESQETVGTQLQHDGGQHHRAACRRFHVGVRQPGVNRPHRHLDREGQEEGNEYQHLRHETERQLVPGHQIEGVRLVVQIQQHDQHQERAGQRVEEELEGRVDPVRTAPHADDEVHRNQRRFEENKEQHGVDRAEHAHHQAGQHEKGGQILGHAHRDDFPGRDHHDDRGQCGQDHQPQRNAVDTEVVGDIEALDPVRLLHELHRRGPVVKTGDQRNRHQQADDGSDQRKPTGRRGIFIGSDKQHQHTEQYRQPYRQTEKMV